VGHAAEDRVLVGVFGELGEELTDANAGDVGGDGFAQGAGVVFTGFGLGIEGIEVRGAATHPELDDGFCSSGACGGRGRLGVGGAEA
jgi:hypothetical protein